MGIRLKTVYAGAIIFFTLLLSGCGPQFSGELNKGEALPSGKVLVVGKIVLEQPLGKKGRKKKASKEPREFFKVQLAMTFDVEKQVFEDDVHSANEVIDAEANETFYVPLFDGVRYIRFCQVTKAAERQGEGADAGSPILTLGKNIMIDIPRDVPAVYIGTIIYHHNGKQATSVVVRDEYKKAEHDLAKMNIGGMNGRMVKKLAVVVNDGSLKH